MRRNKIDNRNVRRLLVRATNDAARYKALLSGLERTREQNSVKITQLETKLARVQEELKESRAALLRIARIASSMAV